MFKLPFRTLVSRFALDNPATKGHRFQVAAASNLLAATEAHNVRQQAIHLRRMGEINRVHKSSGTVAHRRWKKRRAAGIYK